MNKHNNSRRKSRRRHGQSGYAYVMALGMVLMVIVGSQVILRNMATEARSRREAEMIWRGNQYVRAVKMYYRKTGHFPQSQDDLMTGLPGLHFLRSEAVSDPMNKGDGKWRFIYTNAGAIIGSVKYGSLQQMALMDMNGGEMPGAQNGNGNSPNTNGQNSTDNNNSPNSANSTNSIATGSNAAPTGANGGLGQAGLFPPQTGQAFGSTTGQTSGQTTGLNAASVGPQPTGPVDGPVFGGQIIGVGSTVDRGSVRVYKGGKKYNEWEFIWNPLEEQAQAAQGLVSGSGNQGLGLPGLPLGPVNGAPQSSNAPNTNSGTDNGTGNAPNNNAVGTTNSPGPTQ